MATVPSQATDNPFGSNPFERTDPNFQLWADAERLARERWECFRADHMAQMPPDSASPEEFIKFKVALTVALFDAWAEPYCAFRPWRGKKGEFNEVLFDEYLGRFAEQRIEHVTKYANTRGLSHAKTVILETRIAINQRLAHWKAEGYRIAREDREAQPQAQPTAASNIAASEAPAPQPEPAGNGAPAAETAAVPVPTDGEPSSGAYHDGLVAQVKRNFGCDGKSPFVRFYEGLGVTNSEFAAWERNDAKRCGKSKWRALDKAAAALPQ